MKISRDERFHDLIKEGVDSEKIVIQLRSEGYRLTRGFFNRLELYLESTGSHLTDSEWDQVQISIKDIQTDMNITELNKMVDLIQKGSFSDVQTIIQFLVDFED